MTLIYKSLFAISTIGLLAYFLTKKNRAVIIFSMVTMTIAWSGIIGLLKIPGAGALVGMFVFLSYVFLPLLVLDSLKCGYREKIFSISLTLLLLTSFFLTISHSLTLLARESIGLIILLSIVWVLYRNFKIRDDVKRQLILLATFSFYLWLT